MTLNQLIQEEVALFPLCEGDVVTKNNVDIVNDFLRAFALRIATATRDAGRVALSDVFMNRGELERQLNAEWNYKDRFPDTVRLDLSSVTSSERASQLASFFGEDKSNNEAV